MKRTLTSTALIARSHSSPQPWRPKPYNGEIDEGGLMRLDVRTKPAGQRVAKNFEFAKGVPLTCDEGDTGVGDHRVEDAIPFHDNKHFRLDSVLSDETTKIEGARVSGRKIKGTLVWKVDEYDPGPPQLQHRLGPLEGHAGASRLGLAKPGFASRVCPLSTPGRFHS